MSLLHTIRFITQHPLNRGRKLSALLRFVQWQVGSRLAPGEIVYRWIHGSRFLVRTGETGWTGNIYTGLQELSEMGYLLHVLREEDLFVDIGANVGSFSLLACSVVGARGIAFEPVPSTYERLVENLRLNRLEGRLRCFNQGVGAERGSLAFTSDSDTTNHALAAGEECGEVIDVEVTSLDTALRGESPALLKIDVEGYETPVLDGAHEVLQNESTHSVIVELNGSGKRYGYDESRLLERMLDYNFETYSYDPLGRKLIDFHGKKADSDNTLFIRDRSFVEERLKTAPMVSVHGRRF